MTKSITEYFFHYITCFGDNKVKFKKKLTRNIAIFRFLGNDKEWPNRLSHILEKNEVPDTLNGFLVKYEEDATIIIPDSTLYEICRPARGFQKPFGNLLLV